MGEGPGYAAVLGDRDLALVASTSGETVEGLVASPERLVAALGHDAVFAALFDPLVEPDEAFVMVTPGLAFAVLVEHGAAAVSEATFVRERIGGRQAVPVFDTPALAGFVADVDRRIALAAMLGSYTRVASGPRWERHGGRWRKRRFSELDPAQLAGLLSGAGPQQRHGVYRRLGDLSLLLTGVFPDHVSTRPVSGLELERLMRSLPAPIRGRLGRDELAALVDASAGRVYEWFGPRWYRAAAQDAPVPTHSRPLHDLADQFDQARRFLTFLTDRYLFASRARWFPFEPGP